LTRYCVGACAPCTKTAGNAGNTGNTENNSSDIKPFGAIELAAINQERLATPATQAGARGVILFAEPAPGTRLAEKQ
jgi:hypothetical protein